MRSLLIFAVIGLFCVVVADALTDQEMYNQMAEFVAVHSKIPADKKLVENILTSAKWQELVAQFGPTKKKQPETKTKIVKHK